MLQEVCDFRLGQTLDVVRGDAQILAGISKPSQQTQAVLVKYIFIKSVLGNLGEGQVKDKDANGQIIEKDNK